MPSRVPFIDVSENQGQIDWAKMSAAGVGYVIIRAGINGRLDKRLDEYVTGARAAGIVVLVLYWFVNPNSTATAEQQGALAVAACEKYGVPTLMYDLESYAQESSKPTLSGHEYMAWLDRMDAVVKAAGLNRIVYTNASYWNPLYVGVGSSLAELDVIVATYPHYGDGRSNQVVDGYTSDQWEWRAFTFANNGPLTPAGFDAWDGWQFSAGFNKQGAVYGCQSTDLDLNVADAAAINRWLGTSPVPPVPPVPLEPDDLPEDDMATIVQSPDGIIWSVVQAPDGHPALVDTGNEGWWVYGILGYATKPIQQIDQATYNGARRLTRDQWDAMARTYASGIKGVRIVSVPGDAQAF